ncbi:MAG: MFS transporter [Pseudomonadota bacterium]
MTAAVAPPLQDRLPAYSLFGAILAAAGLPIYIYAPPFYAETYGVSLTGIAAVLFWLRMFDAVQDPALGWISERLGSARGIAVALGGAVLAASMIGLFAVEPPFWPLAWFALTITFLFSSFSFLNINFYAEGVRKSGDIDGGHVRLGAWREGGALLGVCIAAVAPTLLASYVAAPFATFAIAFAVIVALAVLAMAPEWTRRMDAQPTGIGTILQDKLALKLLILALVNATPLAVSSTLFLFFVESRLEAPGWEGPLLVLFFLAGAATAPIWSKAAERFGPKPVLIFAMVSAIVSFGGAALLGPGDAAFFAVICVASGATIGADLVLMPALFSARMAAISPNGGQGFGLWSLVQKFTLAFAAIVLLPLLDASGFEAGSATQPPEALALLTILYALVPCGLKVLAIGILARTDLTKI